MKLNVRIWNFPGMEHKNDLGHLQSISKGPSRSGAEHTVPSQMQEVSDSGHRACPPLKAHKYPTSSRRSSSSLRPSPPAPQLPPLATGQILPPFPVCRLCTAGGVSSLFICVRPGTPYSWEHTEFIFNFPWSLVGCLAHNKHPTSF